MHLCNLILFFTFGKISLFQYFLFDVDSSIVLFVQERGKMLILFQIKFAFKAAHKRISANASI